ncbi:MAG TPA: hypothetical protein DEB25_06850 [Desulfobulbaceae bacterium]|nr:hypothetical protein [Desulfobulbaceae bacterium]
MEFLKLGIFWLTLVSIGLALAAIVVLMVVSRTKAQEGDDELTLESLQETMWVYEKALGKEHPSTGIDYNNIALLYNEQGDYAKALEFFQKALAIDEKTLGTEHLDTADSYNSVGEAYFDLKDYAQALEFWLKAYRIWLPQLGEEDSNTETVKNNMECAYEETGNAQPFEDWLRGAL